MELDNKCAIVTGGVSGIGAGISRKLIDLKINVVAVDIDGTTGEKFSGELGDKITFIQGDVSEDGVAEKAVQTAIENYGNVSGLVNCAHASKRSPFTELSEEDWSLSFETGFNATRQFMNAAYPELRKSQGSIVNFCSGAAINGQIDQGSYAAAKEAIRGLSRVVANEWGPENIRVNVVGPLAMSKGVENWREEYPEAYEKTLSKIPLGRFGDAYEDIAPVVAFLLSDDAKYITGQTLMIDGGTNKIY